MEISLLEISLFRISDALATCPYETVSYVMYEPLKLT